MRSFLSDFFQAVLRMAAVAFMFLAGSMQLSPQSSGLNLPYSAQTSNTWDSLLNAARTELTGLRSDFQEALDELAQSRTSLAQWTNTSEVLNRRIDTLEEYNSQITLRMQERDEDLYHAYQEINDLKLDNAELKLTVQKRNKVILGFSLGILLLSILIIGLMKFYFKKKLHPFTRRGG